MADYEEELVPYSRWAGNKGALTDKMFRARQDNMQKYSSRGIEVLDWHEGVIWRMLIPHKKATPDARKDDIIMDLAMTYEEQHPEVENAHDLAEKAFDKRHYVSSEFPTVFGSHPLMLHDTVNEEWFALFQFEYLSDNDRRGMQRFCDKHGLVMQPSQFYALDIPGETVDILIRRG